MKIFIKYVLKSMTEKKGRLLLLLIAIAMSTGLVVASTGMIDIILGGLIKPNIVCYEDRNLVLSPDKEDEPFYDYKSINSDGIKPDSIIKEIALSGTCIKNPDTDDEVTISVTIHARPTELIDKTKITEGNLNDFNNEECVLSERTAKEHDLSVGDTIQIAIAGQQRNLTIKALSAPDGVFYVDNKSAFAIYYPYESLAKEFKVEGKYNLITAEANSDNIKQAIKDFNAANTSIKAEELFNINDIKDQMSSITLLLYGMLAIVVIMSSIIIYSTFKLIITERLTTVGTFLSQGATTNKVKFILRMESFFYGAIGSIFGCGLGVLVLALINNYINPLKEYGIKQKLTLEPYYFVIGIVFAIVLSLISSYLPVRKIGKLQVKEVILNDVRISMRVGYKKFIIGSILLVGSIITYFITGKMKELSPILMVSSIVGMLLAYPKIIDLLSTPLSKLFKGRFKSLFFVTNNLRTSKILLGNITLIIISLLSIIVIRSASSSMIDIVVDAYEKLNCDIEITGLSTINENASEPVSDRLTKDLVKLGINKKDMNYLNNYMINIYRDANDKKPEGCILQCVNIDSYIKYNGYLDLGQSRYASDIKRFKQDKVGIILSNNIAKKTGKKIGDTVLCECNGIKQELTVDAIVDGKVYNGGYVNYISRETLYDFYHINSADQITFTTEQDLDQLVKKLKPLIRSYGASFITKKEMCDRNLEQNQMVIDVMSIFSYLAIVIASLGIINNVSISFIQRKTEFAVLSSVGMENRVRRRILILESFASVTWGMIIASLFSLFLLPIADKVLLLAANITFNFSLSFGVLVTIYIVSLIIVLIATLPVMFKSKKLSIINELKYE